MSHTHHMSGLPDGLAAPEGSRPAERAAVTGPGAAATLCGVFQATAARYPGQVALRTPDGAAAITWGQYAARVRQIAAGLAGLGVGRQDTVALMMTNRPEFHLVDTAAFHLGAVPFSVYNTFAPGQIGQVLANAGSRVVVCERQFAPRLLEVTGGTAVEHVVCVDGKPAGTLTLAELEAGGDPGSRFESCWRAVAPGDLLTLVYTSGTTGPPKGVEITHAQMLAGLAAAHPLLSGPAPGDRVISYLPMAHIVERYVSHYTAMFAGLQVAPLADAQALPGALRQVRPTIFAGVPRVWEKLKAAVETMLAAEPDPGRRHAARQAMDTAQRYARAARAGAVPGGLAEAWRRADEQVLSRIRSVLGLDQVRAAFCGAAPVTPETLEFMLALGISVAEAWGMSECLLGTVNPPGAIRIGTVGTPVRGVELKLADDGELLVRGPTVMKGYHHDPARTAEAIGPGGWLRTGDLAAIDDGYVTITGRKKELIINAAGKNMSPVSIEAAVLAASPLIAHVVATGDRRPCITALIVLDPDAAAAFAARHGITGSAPTVLADHPAIRAAVAAAVEEANGRLSRVEQIKRYTIMPGFWEPGGDEITPTMKLKRASIAAKYAGLIESLYAPAAEAGPADPPSAGGRDPGT
ncbi:MAG TPA: long-chain fatty acid--CoA ligase [Trebonia sp.]